jgi:hypothetical protein
MPWLAALTLVPLLVLPACTHQERPTPAPSGSGEVIAVLTPLQPHARLEPPVPNAPGALELRILSIENGSRQGIVIRATLEVTEDGRRERETLGYVSPLPPDRPAVFTLSIPERVARPIAASLGRVAVLLDLSPASASSPLRTPLVVVVGVALRPAPY